jgi:predicted permease
VPGFVCRRRALLGQTAASELNRFVVWLALPALLFDITAHSDWSQLANLALVVTFSVVENPLTMAPVVGALVFGAARGRTC